MSVVKNLDNNNNTANAGKTLYKATRNGPVANKCMANKTAATKIQAFSLDEIRKINLNVQNSYYDT